MLQDAKGPLADMYRRLTRLMVAAGEDGQDGQAKTAFKTGLAEMARSVTQNYLIGGLLILTFNCIHHCACVP